MSRAPRRGLRLEVRLDHPAQKSLLTRLAMRSGYPSREALVLDVLRWLLGEDLKGLDTEADRPGQ